MSEKIENKNDFNRMKQANLNRLNKTYNMLSSKNNWFYLAIILINIVTLVLAWVFESNSYGVASGVFDGFDNRYLYLLLVSLLVVGLLKVIPDYIFLYKKTKHRQFSSVLMGNIMCGYYKTISIHNDSVDSLYVESLKATKVSNTTAQEMVNLRAVANRIASVIYYIVVFVLGTIFAFGSTNVWLYILALVGLVFNICITLIILYFDRFKAKYLIVIAKLCKLLYKLKLVKDYEKLYNLLVVKLMQFGTVFKNNRLYMFAQICCGILVKFVIHIMLFFVLSAFNVATWQSLVEILLACSILDIIVGIVPTPKGTLIYELLFLIIFRTIFISGYVLYGMVIYRIISYFLIQLVYGVGYLFGIRKKLKFIQAQISEEMKNN